MAIRLRDVLPREFFREFLNTPAAKLLDCEVAIEHSMTNESVPYERWPGPARNVMTWWQLADGRAVGWNENDSRGWSFPVCGRKN